MATKSFNDICVEYAHQLGKGLPLTAPEMCNALVMYLNQQVNDMNQMVQTALNAVAEVQKDLDEGEFATVSADNVFNGDNTFTKSIKADGGMESVDDRGDGIEITNEKIIFHKIGSDLSLVTGSFMNNQSVILPTRSGTLALQTDIPSYTEFSGVVYTTEEGAEISYGDNKINLPIIAGDNVTIGADSSGSHLKISAANVMTTNTYQSGLSPKAFRSDTDTAPVLQIVNPNNNNVTVYELACVYFHRENNDPIDYQIYYPHKHGTFALTDDIPDLDNYTGTVHIVQGTAGSGIAVHDTANASPYTKYGYDKIETYGNSNTLQYTLNIPNKNGTIATLDDIGSPSDSKYFTRVIFHNTDDDTQYIIFSCLTISDYSSYSDYTAVVSMLNYYGASTKETAFPCTGKTTSGGIVVGVYTDGTNIIVFDTDNTTEELTMTCEIKFISK